MKIHIKCSEFGWVKNVTEERRRNSVLCRVGMFAAERREIEGWTSSTTKRFPEAEVDYVSFCILIKLVLQIHTRLV